MFPSSGVAHNRCAALGPHLHWLLCPMLRTSGRPLGCPLWPSVGGGLRTPHDNSSLFTVLDDGRAVLLPSFWWRWNARGGRTST